MRSGLKASTALRVPAEKIAGAARRGRHRLSADTYGVGDLLKQRVADFVAAVRRVADGGTARDPQVVAQLRRDSDPLARLLPVYFCVAPQWGPRARYGFPLLLVMIRGVVPPAPIEGGDDSTFPAVGHLADYAGLAPATRSSGSSIRGEQPSRSG